MSSLFMNPDGVVFIGDKDEATPSIEAISQAHTNVEEAEKSYAKAASMLRTMTKERADIIVQLATTVGNLRELAEKAGVAKKVIDQWEKILKSRLTYQK